MPDYKKRKRNKLLSSPKKPKVNKAEDNDIKMSPYSAAKRSGDIKVVKGGKGRNKRKYQFLSVLAAVIIVVVVLLETLIPAGLVHTVDLGISLIGSGGYPIELQDTQTVNTVSMGTYYYVLSGTKISAFSNSGKQLLDYTHGFENPVIKTSEKILLLYSQGGTELLVFDFKRLKFTVKTDKPIITANASDSGNFAVACSSDKYASQVTVYGSRGKELYEWYSAEDTVNSIALSRNGKKLAVASFNAKSGEYKSKLSILNFKSATPEYTESFDDTLIYSLSSKFSSKLTVVLPSKIKSINWSNYKSLEYTNDYNISVFKSYKGGNIAVFNRESNQTDNKIAVLGHNGKLKFQFTVNMIISDIALLGNHIYIMNETEVICIDREGKIINKASCGFGGIDIVPVSFDTVLVVTDNKTEKIKIEKEK